MAAQQWLRKCWLSSSLGHLSKWEQAKALGLREASKEIHGGQANVPWICARLVKTGGGQPQRAALHEFFKKVDADRTPMILTTNNWDLSGLAADELEWVTANCVAVRVDTPVFAAARPAPPSPKPLPRARPSLKRQRGPRELDA